jgi:AraC-like DNA-binding protein
VRNRSARLRQEDNPAFAGHLREPMNTDPLSDVLRHVQFRAAVFYYVNLGPTWAIEASPSAHIASAVLPGASHVMEFHVVARGGGWACVDGLAPVRIERGDIVVFPQGDAHVMCSSTDVSPLRRPSTWVQESAAQPRPIPITYHGGAHQLAVDQPLLEAETVLVCGFLGCEARPFMPFISSLPRLLHLPADRSSPWIAAVVDHAARESYHRTPGGWAVLERLSETMFVDTLRRFIEQEKDSEQRSGWFAAMRDRYIGNALRVIHSKPEHPWTVEELGRSVGLSRSSLHQRFVDVLGETPAQYIARWRVQLGSELLRNSNWSILGVAHEVGYASEAAFSRAFKRIVGESPSVWRRTAAA